MTHIPEPGLGHGESVCPTYKDCQQERKSAIEFHATVLAKLESIETFMRERKVDINAENLQIWSAIDGIRSDIKNLYWKIGLISGGTAIVTSLATSLVLGKH